MKARKIVTIAIMTALAVVLSIIESFIPVGIPGVKLGLSNVVTLTVLYLYSYKEATLVHFFRIFIVGLTYTGLFSTGFMISLSGGTLSIIAMISIYYLSKRKIFTVSSASALFHSIGQIICCMVIMKTTDIAYYLFIMSMLSVASGIVTALLSYFVLKAFRVEMNKIGVFNMTLYSITLVTMVVVSVLFLNRTTDSNGKIAKVYVSNECVLKIDLSGSMKYETYGNLEVTKESDGDISYFTFELYDVDRKNYDTIKLSVRNGEIRVLENECRGKTCVKGGYISESYERIVCTPNNMLIRIESNQSEIDALI